MNKLYAYKMIDGVDKSWDDIDFQNECIVVAIIKGEDNKECETKAVENGYGDTDIYGWTYIDDIEIADDAEYID